MKAVSPIAAAAALVLHGAMIGVVMNGLTNEQPAATPPALLSVDLLPAPPSATPAVLPVAPPAPATPSPRKTMESRPRAVTKSAPAAREAPASQVQVPAASFEAKPSASGTTAITAEPAAAPAAPPAPAKTSASVASYAGSNRKPPYPRLSLRNEEQGTVVLRVLVKADGTAGAVELKKSSGYPLLDESARRTVPRWRFNPATVDGKPVAEWYEISIPFKLQDN